MFQTFSLMLARTHANTLTCTNGCTNTALHIMHKTAKRPIGHSTRNITNNWFPSKPPQVLRIPAIGNISKLPIFEVSECLSLVFAQILQKSSRLKINHKRQISRFVNFRFSEQLRGRFTYVPHVSSQNLLLPPCLYAQTSE